MGPGEESCLLGLCLKARSKTRRSIRKIVAFQKFPLIETGTACGDEINSNCADSVNRRIDLDNQG